MLAEEKLDLHRQVLTLHKENVSTRKIAKKLNVPKSTVHAWISDKHHPLTNFNIPSLKPSPELSYVLGVVFGDGSVFKSGRNYSIALSAVDYSFVREFNICICQVLNKKRLYSIRKNPKPKPSRMQHKFEARSKILFQFLKGKHIRDFTDIIEAYPSDFVRGFADSEGCVTSHSHHRSWLEPHVGMANMDRELLKFIRELLKEFRIKAHVHQRSLDITNKEGVLKFYECVGFANEEKKNKLNTLVHECMQRKVMKE